MSYEYDATVVRVKDGDTVILRLEKTYTQDIDFGFYIKDQMVLKKQAEIDFRLLGINAPEKNTAAGPAATAELERLLALGPLRVTSYKTDKYGRWLARIAVTQADGTVLIVNDEMLKGGFAVPYLTDNAEKLIAGG